MAPLIPTELSHDPFSYSLLAFVLAVAAGILARIVAPWWKRSTLKPQANQFARKHGLAISAGLLSCLGTVYLGGDLAVEANVVLEADMQIGDGQAVGSYVNDTSIPPRQVPLVPGVRRIYRFERIPAILRYLRIDPTISPGTKVSIYSFTIISEGRVVRRYEPNELRGWTLYNLSPVPGDAAALNLLTSQNSSLGTFIANDVTLVASHRPGWLLYLLDRFRRPHLYSIALLSCLLLFLLCGISSKEGLIEAALVGAVAVAALPVSLAVRALPLSPPPVTSAIGNASYVGYPKSQDYLASVILVSLCAAFAWLASRYFSKGRHESAAQAAATDRPPSPWLSRLAIAGALASLTFIYLPDLEMLLTYYSQLSYRALHWDYGNFLFWHYLVHKGYLPFRDFWYPYSGFYGYGLPFPTGPVLTSIQQILTLWFLFLALRYAIGLRAAFWVFVSVMMAVGLDEFHAWYRYLLGIILALFYVALQKADRIELSKHLALAAASGFVFFFEPTQFIYAGSGMVAHTVLVAAEQVVEIRDWRPAIRRVLHVLRGRLTYLGIPMAAGVSTVLGFFAVKGMLPGFIRFHLSLSDGSAYGAIPADVTAWTLPALRYETVFMLPFFAVTLALYAWFRDGKHMGSAHTAVMVLGLAGLMAMQKHVLRPPLLDQVEAYPCIAAMLYGVAAWPGRTRLQSVVAGVFVGTVLGLAQYHGVLRTFERAAVSGPAMLARDYNVAFHRTAEIRAANAGLYDASRFVGFEPQKAVLDAMREQGGWRSPEPVFVLGDDSVFYMLAGGKFPYVSTVYNSSPISEQERVLEWLQRQKPRFVIWNPSITSFDGVPNLVRVPLIYQFVVENYRYLTAAGPYHILIALAERPGTDPAYWARQLGSGLDLGSIPRLTRASDYRPCPDHGSVPCAHVIFLHTPKTGVSGKAVLTIVSSAGAFTLTFDTASGSHDYVIDLDRLWFRKLLGPAIQASVSVREIQMRSELRIRRQGVLY